MPAPEVSSFGDGSHAPGASGILVDGAGFGHAGNVWIYANGDLTGAADQLTVTNWNDAQITVTIPGSLTNTAGTRYLFVEREDSAWSNPQAFTLESGATTGALSRTLATLAVSAVGTLPLQASLSATLGAISTTAAGSSQSTGALSASTS